MEEPVWGSSATMLEMARLGEQGVTTGCHWMQASYQRSGLQFRIFLSEPYGDRAATCEVAESGKIGKPRTGAFPLP
jgi:hypothetical protein